MTEHAAEIIPYLITVIAFFAVYVLNGVNREIKELKTTVHSELKDLNRTVKSLETDLRGGYANLDRRVTRIEARNEIKDEHVQD